MLFAEVGSARILTREFRDANGALADPDTVVLSVRSPDGTVTTPDPENPEPGVYTYKLTFDTPGSWWVRWVGEGGDVLAVAFEEEAWVSPVFSPLLWGASLEGVQALVTDIVLSSNSRTPPAAVERFIAQAASRLNTATLADTYQRRGYVQPADLVSLSFSAMVAALETLTDDEAVTRLATIRAAASDATEMGAAALVEDAQHPERATLDNEASSYGAVLWSRFHELVDALVRDLAAYLRARGVIGTTAPSANSVPLISSPPPYFRTTTNF